MKASLFLAVFGFISFLHASNENENLVFSTKTIYQQEDYALDNIALLYSEQGNCSFENKNYLEALSNYQKVISYLQDHQLSDPSNLLNAICGSMFCYDMLDEEQFAKETFNELVYQISLLKDDVEKIDWFRKSPIFSTYKENSHHYISRICKNNIPEMTPEENCQFQCNGYALAAAFACGRVPHPAIQALCYGCIFGLEQLCIRCCKGEGFWENCVRGLRRLFHDPENPENPAPHPYE